MLVAKWELTGINGYVCNIIRILHWTRHGGGKKKRQEPNDDGEASYVSSWCDSSVPFVVVAGRWPGLAGHKGKKRKRTPTQSTTAAFSLFSWSCCFYERQRRFFFPFQRWPLSHFFSPFAPTYPSFHSPKAPLRFHLWNGHQQLYRLSLSCRHDCHHRPLRAFIFTSSDIDNKLIEADDIWNVSNWTRKLLTSRIW